MTGEIILYNVRAYKHDVPQRGDIIFFDGSEYINSCVLLCKRVIGVPGDIIVFINGNIYINGSKYEEDYLPKDVVTVSDSVFAVPDDSVFVLGDNREDSFDSRFFKNTYVSYEDIKGKYIWGIYSEEAADIIIKSMEKLESVKRLRGFTYDYRSNTHRPTNIRNI